METDEDGSWCSRMYTKNEVLALALDVGLTKSGYQTLRTGPNLKLANIYIQRTMRFWLPR